MNLHCRTLGQGTENLLILHGLLGMSDNWLSVGKDLARERKVFLPDLRNHGLSPYGNKHNFEEICRDIKEFADKKKLKKFVLAGHSMGGKAALTFADIYPQYIEKLIVMDIMPASFPNNFLLQKQFSEHQKILTFMADFPINEMCARSDIYAAIRSHFEADFVIQMIQKNILRSPEGSFRWKANAAVLLKSLQEIAQDVPIVSENFTFPTLFVFGSHSPYFSQEGCRDIYENIPRVKIDVIQNARHALHVDQKEALVECMRDFMNKEKF